LIHPRQGAGHARLRQRYERGEWDEAERIAGGVGVPAASLPDTYREALRWTAALAQEPERKAG